MDCTMLLPRPTWYWIKYPAIDMEAAAKNLKYWAKPVFYGHGLISMLVSLWGDVPLLTKPIYSVLVIAAFLLRAQATQVCL